MTVINQVTPITVPELDSAAQLTGNEVLAVSQGGVSVKAAVSALPQGISAGVVTFGNTGGSPFPNYRTLKAGTGITITDSGAQNDLTVAFDGATSTVVWGNITGTLSNQTDLQAVLDAKADTSALGTAAYEDVGYFADAAQGALADTAIQSSEKGAADGVAPLGSDSKISTTYLPAAVLGALSYQGTWNATTNSPTLVSSTGTKGYYYVVSTAGSTNLDGITDWKVGDWAVFNGTAWEKIDNTDAVVSVNSQTGVVVLGTADIADSLNKRYVTDAQLTVIGNTSGINTGDQTSVTGNAGTATALATGRTISISGDLDYTSPSFDGTSNVTAAGTLATVNANVGSFGSATAAGTFTVNAKGLITAAGNTTITPAVGSIIGLGTGVATFLATPSSANLAAALTDETGSGAAVFATSPTLVTPTLGVASATSVNFGQDALNYYDEGTWTPSDGSGAGLSFSNVSATYVRIGKLVYAHCRLDYPATADASSAKIAGLPFTSANNSAVRQGSISYSTSATARWAIVDQNTTTASIFVQAGSSITNAGMSSSVNWITFIYEAA